MNNKILLNTGLFARRGSDVNEAIKKVSEHDVDGIEIGTSFLDVLVNFKLSQDGFKIIKKYKYLALHAPVNFFYRNDRYTAEVIDKLKQVASLLDAKYIVFHTHSIQDFQIFKECKLDCCLENDRDVHKVNADQMKKILDENPNFKFVLDTAHAMSHSEDEVKNLVKLLKDKIVAVHLSARVDDMDHIPLHLAQEKLEQLEPIKALDCPVVLECWHSYQDKVEEEIK